MGKSIIITEWATHTFRSKFFQFGWAQPESRAGKCGATMIPATEELPRGLSIQPKALLWCLAAFCEMHKCQNAAFSEDSLNRV